MSDVQRIFRVEYMDGKEEDFHIGDDGTVYDDRPNGLILKLDRKAPCRRVIPWSSIRTYAIHVHGVSEPSEQFEFVVVDDFTDTLRNVKAWLASAGPREAPDTEDLAQRESLLSRCKVLLHMKGRWKVFPEAGWQSNEDRAYYMHDTISNERVANATVEQAGDMIDAAFRLNDLYEEVQAGRSWWYLEPFIDGEGQDEHEYARVVNKNGDVHHQYEATGPGDIDLFRVVGQLNAQWVRDQAEKAGEAFRLAQAEVNVPAQRHTVHEKMAEAVRKECVRLEQKLQRKTEERGLASPGRRRVLSQDIKVIQEELKRLRSGSAAEVNVTHERERLTDSEAELVHERERIDEEIREAAELGDEEDEEGELEDVEPVEIPRERRTHQNPFIEQHEEE